MASPSVASLRERLKRKRSALEQYLNSQYYDSCRRILAAVKLIDGEQMFSNDPSSLVSGYRAVVKQPMCIHWIGKKLDSYEYTTCDEFVADMRLLVNNCYLFNDEASPFCAVARRMEVEMEGMFVKELGLPSPSDKDIKTLATAMTPSTTERILRVVSLYEGYVHTKGAKLDLSKFSCATRMRILQVLKEASAQREGQAPHTPRDSHGASKGKSRSLAKGAPRPIPVKIPVPVKAPPPPAVAAPAPPPPADQHVARRERSLDRVPQNTRTDGTLLKNISPLQSLNNSSSAYSENSN
ncbi:DNA-binding protein [Strigomonas culicis]|uniref:DNA-binding protein n=1 Tax=Strigomonas culicis TaxID=28005 RepID=S9UH55_9TRYP|nr:DNA-binding protein [Strigomonas culicis]|eukprot:EPY28273.1 DNA-binding protein [Strigomonas culicis]